MNNELNELIKKNVSNQAAQTQKLDQPCFAERHEAGVKSTQDGNWVRRVWTASFKRGKIHPLAASLLPCTSTVRPWRQARNKPFHWGEYEGMAWIKLSACAIYTLTKPLLPPDNRPAFRLKGTMCGIDWILFVYYCLGNMCGCLSYVTAQKVNNCC